MRNPRALLVALMLVVQAGVARAEGVSAADAEFFEKRIRPVLAQQCYKCHASTANKVKGGLLVDSLAGLLRGGESGPAIVPGKPGESLLITAVRWADKELQMPEKEQLPKTVIADLERWVAIGAPWPGQTGKDVSTGPAAAGHAEKYPSNYAQLEKELWSWQPIANPPPPAVKNAAWVKDDLDRFVLAKLEEKKLEPSPRADRFALLRRATYDLTGLPPTPEEIESFLRDPSPGAFEKVVDRLLASPRFGERWGRHWLDVARYAESSGMARNYVYYYAWRYRDYVIAALNDDVPYDRFIREQVAGDLLPAKTDEERDRLKVATGFLAVGPRDFVERNPKQFEMNTVDEQIDAVTRAVLATTVACARCHDHKFDPIPTSEYYALAGIFASSTEYTGVTRRRMVQQNPYDDDRLMRLSGYVEPKGKGKKDEDLDRDEVREQARKTFARLAVATRLGGYTRPMTAPKPLAMGVADDWITGDIRVLIRGEITEPGDRVRRGFLTIPSMSAAPAVGPKQSGRRELADWLTRSDNPLTARVMANRIWQHLFGQGIVRSVDNFGVTGDRPTNAALLDHLATRFAGPNAWSVKKTIRQIMLSATYQQSATFDRAKHKADPENELHWRMNQRRLEAEAIRDGMLSASGKLVTTPPVGSVALDLPPIQIQAGGRLDVAEMLANMNFRSVYLPVFRNALPDALDVFDFADPSMVTGQRDVTTVPPQALYMLNSSFVTSQAQAMAYRLAGKAGPTDQAKVELAYLLALGRQPSNVERDRAVTYVNAYLRDPAATPRGKTVEKARVDAWASFCQALFAAAEFRYLN